MKYYTYILQNTQSRKFYTGSCEDLERRLQRHNSGQVKSTKSGAPYWKIVYIEEYTSRSEAQTREYNIKKKKSRKYIEFLITKDNSAI